VSADPALSPEPAPADDPTRTIQTPEAAPGIVIGPYQLVRQLGEGGMGTVYHAHQFQPIRRDVALKIIKPGMDSRQVIARFESERQALALMDHPNIARVFDAGASAAGRPYFVMELVDGVPITHYCDSKCLTLRQRIELFIPVCQAIQHAHQKGVIHRDIKPSNVLVAQHDGKPVPKVIDFGLAKALGHELSDATVVTHLGTVVGTLEYMSPEQADIGRHDIDTRSDVYSLGALLYELLTGTLPLVYDRAAKPSYVEVLQQIREEEPAPPSARLRRSATLAETAARRGSDPGRLPKLLDRELDWVVMKTLEKDRTRRYETVNGLTRDLQRYLEGEPVEAGPPSAAYRARKFVQKHRLWLGTAAAFTALLIAAVVVSAWMAVRATRAEQSARAVNEFLQGDLLAQASSTQQGAGTPPDPEIKVRTLLDRAAARIAGKFETNPRVEASIQATIGESYRGMGLYAQSLEPLQRALDLDRRVLGGEHPDALRVARMLGDAYYFAGKYAQAESVLVPTVAASRRVMGAANSQTREAMSTLGKVYVAEAKYALARPLLTEALEIQRRMLGAQHPLTLDIMSNLARIYYLQGNVPEAEGLLKSVLEGRRLTAGPDHPFTLTTMNNLAVLYQERYQFAEAEPLLVQVLGASRRVRGAEHPDTLNATGNLAVLYSDSGRYSQAEPLLLKVLEISRRVLGPEHPRTLAVMRNLVALYNSERKFPEANALGEETVETSRRVLGTENPDTLLAMYIQAATYREEGRFAAAESQLVEVLAAQRREGPKHTRTANTMDTLGGVRVAAQKYADAEPVLRECLAIRQQAMPDDFRRYATEAVLGASLAGQGKHAEAEALLITAYEGMKERQGKTAAVNRRRLIQAGEWIIQLYEKSSQADKVVEWTQNLQQTKLAMVPKLP
jgi:eukaryotic-like serine/threonine-protein kinase